MPINVPGKPNQQQVAPANAPKKSKRRRRRRGKFGLFILLGLALILTAGGVQAWRVMDSIDSAEQSAYVPFPTRSTGIVATLEPGAVQPTPGRAEPDAADSGRISVFRDVVSIGIGGNPGGSEVWQGKTSLNIMVLGIDRRPDGSDENADVIILARVDLANKRVAAVSIPRDLLIDIPGFGPDKINSGFASGTKANPNDPAAGVGVMRDTVEQNFGIMIDAYVLIDFAGFRDVVDAVGGVTIDVPYEIFDPEYPTEDLGTEELRFLPGEQRMDGETALKYVRTRHGDSDDQRRRRQLQVILALFQEGKSISSFTKIDDMIVAFGDSVQTSFTLKEQLTLAKFGLDVDQTNIRMSSLEPPLIAPGYTAEGAWIYEGDLTAIAAFLNGSLDTGDSHYPAEPIMVLPSATA